METVNDLTELNAIIESENKVVVDFFAPWCGPCKMVGPILERIEQEVSATIIKVNVDTSPDAAHAFNVTSVPTVVIFKSSEEVAKFVGVQPKDKYIEALS
jgi:thioredoxin 1